MSWIRSREPATQVWPAPPVKTAAVLAPIVALSRSASAKTMFGLLPPSSKARGLRVGAERSVMRRAVWVEPVKAILRTSGWRTRASPTTSPRPLTTLTTPGGKPAASKSGAIARIEADACSAGFSTTVFPAASAAPTLAARIASGEFQGTIRPTTPRGSWSVKLKLVRETSIVSPWILSAAPAQ